jgi:Icc-related predicted phosphoesterase
MAKAERTVRVAALADLHCTRASTGAFQSLFKNASESADVLLICGDLTDYGLPEEAQILARELKAAVKVPVIAVLGNHDFESGRPHEVRTILAESGATLLDGESCEIRGIGFAGVKGFAGGFGRGTLGAWGESAVKAFVQEAIDESLKLESALARLRTPHRIALLHYSPIRATVENEPPEIHPFLGCSRLEEPLGRYPVTAVFHGHAHKGSPEGKTAHNVPVYNVSLPLMRHVSPDRPFRLLQVPVAKEETPAGTSMPSMLIVGESAETGQVVKA